MALTARRVRRIESWDTWKAAGGVRKAVLTELLSAVSNVTLTTDRLTVVVPLDSAAATYLTARTIIRVDESDSVYDEWKVVSRSTDDVAGTVTINATSIRSTDLAESSLVSRVDSDGVIVHDFESLGLTPTAMINTWILPALAAQGFTWITLGTITPTAPIDITFSWDTPLAALLRIAAASNSELDIRRTGDTGYVIDLVTKVNSAAQRADLRVDKNLVNLRLDEDTIDQATRVFPRGAQDADGNYSTMSRAEWKVTAVAGSVITLADPAGGAGPLQFNDQLNSKYLRKVDGTLTQITDSDAAAQTVTVASASGIAANDLIQVRADSSGTDMVYLQNPLAVAAYGVKIAVKDLPDVPGTNNLIKNPFMRTWPGSLATNWSAVNAPTLAKQTVAPFTALGGASIKVTSSNDGQGVQSDAVPIFPTAQNPYVSSYARVWVASGSARVEMVLTVSSGTKVVPIAPQVSSNSVLAQWEDLGVAGIDANAMGATAVAIRVVQNGPTASVFYVDAAQATDTPTQEPLVEGSSGTRLWQAANEDLRTGSTPVVSYSAPIVDLEQIDPVTWAESAIIIGAPVRVGNPRLDIDILTRLLEINRDYLNPLNSSVVLSNKFDDLTDLLAQFRRSGRQTPNPSGPDSGGFDVTATPVISFTGTREGVISVKVQGGEGTYVTRCVARLDRLPSGDEIDAATPSTPGVRTGVFPNIITAKAGKQFYIGARAYSESGAGSVAARLTFTWLGLGSTDGADVIIGDIFASAKDITFPTAFDDECAYCEIWIREYISSPGVTPGSVENLSPAPFTTLSLGADAMVPGVAKPVVIPISAPLVWLVATFVPFDHLAKRGNVQTFAIRGSSGKHTGGHTGSDPVETFGTDLVFWWDPTQETGYSSDDQITTGPTDFSGNGNDGISVKDRAGGTFPDEYAKYITNVKNGLPVFRFIAGSTPFDHLKQYFKSPECFDPTGDAVFLMFVAHRHTAHLEFNIFARIATNANLTVNGARVSESHNVGTYTNDHIEYFETASGADQLIPLSLTTDFFIYAIQFSSASAALQYFNGNADTSFDPHSDADGTRLLMIGEGNLEYGDVLLAKGVATPAKIAAAFSYQSRKWDINGYSPLGTVPDPPISAVQTARTSSTITVDVTIASTGPAADHIRVYVNGIGGTRSFDVAVTVSPGGTQTIVIDSLDPDTGYAFAFSDVASGLESSSIGFGGTTAVSSGTLDAPTITGITYNVGDQAFWVTITPGANNPSDTTYEIEWDTYSPSTGVYTADDSSRGQSTTLGHDFPQVVGADKTLSFRVWAMRFGWTNSARSAAVTATAPAA